MPYVTESNITEIVLDRWNAVPNPRLHRIMQSMIRHLHAFVRDIEPTEQEWLTAIEWLTLTGQLSTDKRQEFILASDVVGVSMLVDCINHRLPGGATPTTVTGPFHVDDSPDLDDGGNIAKGAPGELCLSSARFAISLESRSPAPRSTSGRRTARAFTMYNAAPRSPGCAASSNREATARSWCKPCFRSLIRSRWTAVLVN